MGDRKAFTGNIFLTGSKKYISRVIYTDGTKHFIKWHGQYIEVINSNNVSNVTAGWRTVEAY